MKLNKILNKDLNMVRKEEELIYESELRRSVSGIAAPRLQFTKIALLCFTLFFPNEKSPKKILLWNPRKGSIYSHKSKELIFEFQI